jgi:hypothetical protein
MAVELAKVSLWLDAFTLGAPLNFLDHHLRCGDSLIGATFTDLEAATHLGLHHKASQHFAIGQRALFLRKSKVNILWDCLPLLDEAVVEAMKPLGGISAIAISHPNCYSGMVEWSRALGGVPIYLHAADRKWVMRSLRMDAGRSWGFLCRCRGFRGKDCSQS